MPTFIPYQPRLSAIVRTNATGELTIGGTSRPLVAPDISRLRSGIIARCAEVGRQVGRPVRLTVADVDATYQLCIHPDAFVQVLAPDGTVPDHSDLEQRAVGDSPCRHCGRPQSLRHSFCTMCGTRAPHDIQARPNSQTTAEHRAEGR